MLQRKQSDTWAMTTGKNPVARSCLNHTVDDSVEAYILTLKKRQKNSKFTETTCCVERRYGGFF